MSDHPLDHPVFSILIVGTLFAAITTSWTDSVIEHSWVFLAFSVVPVGWPFAILEGFSIWLSYLQ